MAGALSQQPTTHVVLLLEKEDAAYFYNDLTSLLGDDNISSSREHTSGQ
ncbi:MAG: hypothetical protein R2758_04650 [Bacteroidales bacterium]